MDTRYNDYINRLKEFGATQATNKPAHFYKLATEKTAFILNIYCHDSAIRIVYGFTSTAFFAMGEGERESFEQFGLDDNDCTFRHSVVIANDDDACTARRQIEDFYKQYVTTEKDELLALAKERRKAFLKRIDASLKPLGFKKKGNQWTRALTDGYCLEFYAQKSAFSDQYYFNISMMPIASQGITACYHTRVATTETGLIDWQLMPAEEIQALLDDAVQQEISPLLSTPLSELGQSPKVWTKCTCKRDFCESCWVAHNLWEAKELT